jgi:gliding motility-associated lipoprotein GldD
MKKALFCFLITMGLCVSFSACKPKPLPEPKPMGYFRIDLPGHQYRTIDTALPFRYEQSVFANTTIERQKDNTLWMTVSYPDLKASLRFTCFDVKNADSLRNLMISEDKMVKFHYQKADDVQYSVIQDPESNLWGQTYEILGKEVATPFQFWLTDSTHRFVRANLYFDCAPNNDSLQPIIQFLKEDALHLINTFEWKP